MTSSDSETTAPFKTRHCRSNAVTLHAIETTLGAESTAPVPASAAQTYCPTLASFDGAAAGTASTPAGSLFKKAMARGDIVALDEDGVPIVDLPPVGFNAACWVTTTAETVGGRMLLNKLRDYIDGKNKARQESLFAAQGYDNVTAFYSKCTSSSRHR